jgi:hypothetical protein
MTMIPTGHMRNKLEYLLRNTIFEGHEDGCGGRQSMAEAEVVRVERIENHALWQAYAGRRLAIKTASSKSPIKKLAPPPICKIKACKELDSSINEVYLFHGCPSAKVETIATQGLDTRLAGTNAGSLYGQGTYFAENSCKSMQYTAPPNADEEFCVLYCRVVLGRVHTTKTALGDDCKRPPVNKDSNKPYDSVVAPTGPMANHHNGNQVHREFIVYDMAQSYPEFAVWYKV